MENQPRKILLVEDDQDDYILTRSLLNDARGGPFDLQWVETYDDGLDSLVEHPPDAALVDYHLGAHNGLELVREVVARGCRIPIILLTGQGSYDIDLEAMKAGATDYLTKGEVTATLLERTIRYAIERRQAQDALQRAHDELEVRVEERTRELARANQDLRAEIAERLRVEAQLRVRTTALEAAANGICITDRLGNILWSNPSFNQMTGYETEEVIGRNIRLIRSGQHDVHFYQSLWDTINAGRVWRGEIVNRRKDGSIYIEEQTITPVLDESGEISHFIAIKQDITDRKQAEETIRQSAARAEVLSEISRSLAEARLDPQAIFDIVARNTASLIGDACLVHLLDEKGELLQPVAFYHSNRWALDLLREILPSIRLPVGEEFHRRVFQEAQPLLVSGREIEEYLPRGGQALHAYLEHFGCSSLMAVPLWIEGKPFGTMLLARDQSSEPFTSEDLLLLQSLADRTALAYANARLYKDLQSALQEEQIMRLKLVQAEKQSALSRMVASVAHELNNPIQTIQNCLFLTQQDTDPESQVNEFLEMAISEARRVSKLVWQLREIYRPTKPGPMLPLDISNLLVEVCSLLAPHLQYQHVEWKQSPLPGNGECLIVRGISDQLKQVFLNISLNAVDAMQPDGGALTVSLAIQNRPEPCLGVSFTDTGPGILPENKPKLFEPFYTTKEGGTGLGLSICEDIVHRHSGWIEVESQPGEGAMFTVWLPLAG